MNRSNVSIPFTKIDSRLEMAIWVLSGAILASVVFHYSVLPDRVPIHFGINGKPDSWSGKDAVWLLVAIYGVVAVMLFFVNKQPQYFNYSVTETTENAPQLYQMGARMIRVIRLWISLLFLCIQWMVYDSAMSGEASKLNYMLMACLVGMLGMVGWGIYRFHIKAPK